MSDYKRLTNKNTDEFNPEYDFCSFAKEVTDYSAEKGSTDERLQ